MSILNEPPSEAVNAIRMVKSDVENAFASTIDNLTSISNENYATGPENQAKNLLTQVSVEIQSLLNDISGQLMWTPYAAFYGETNAGKSTLIETLRLYFGEKTPDAGSSIGDGRSDFTREATFYPCAYRNRAFTLIDVPGIEGKESIVEEAIKSALAHSHIVFYITPDPRPPQGGEEKREGTLEKMERQLKPQAKVWAIWNKKIRSPRALAKPLLTTGSDEWRSLHEGPNSLDTKLHGILGKRYQTSLAVSARPAFLALATHMGPENGLIQERSRFLERIPEAQLAKICGIDKVANLIADEMPDIQDIIRANLRKISIPIKEKSKEIENISKKIFYNHLFSWNILLKN